MTTTANKFIPLMQPNITEEDIQEVVRVLRSGMIIQGKEVLGLEMNVASYLNSPHAIAVTNGTATMHLALEALGIGKGDEVIIPAFSYIATANVVELVGATPIFVDINIETFTINPELIEGAITPNTKAIMPVHEFGVAADMISIMAIAKKHNLYVIEDAACALGAHIGGQKTGTFGDFGSFSLHPRKAITSGEGGIITAKTAENDRKVRILRNHGMDPLANGMDFVAAGYNCRMTDFQAAMVNSQMDRLDNGIAYRNELAAIYLEHLSSDKMLLPSIPKNQNHTWQTFHVVINDDINRDDLIVKLRERGIGTNYGAQCMPSQTFFQQKYQLDVACLFPNALRAYKQGLALPCYDKMTKDDVAFVVEAVNLTIN